MRNLLQTIPESVSPFKTKLLNYLQKEEGRLQVVASKYPELICFIWKHLEDLQRLCMYLVKVALGESK